jgi:hypothetical protein
VLRLVVGRLASFREVMPSRDLIRTQARRRQRV